VKEGRKGGMREVRKGEGKGNLAPRSFLKVGAYARRNDSNIDRLPPPRM